MIICEYRFDEFNARGSDKYINSWASRVDLMAEEGWEVLECARRAGSFGLWTVLLCRPSRNDPGHKLKDDISIDRED